jgi:hypothetical protein
MVVVKSRSCRKLGFVQRVGSFNTAPRILLKFGKKASFSSSACTIAFYSFRGTALGDFFGTGLGLFAGFLTENAELVWDRMAARVLSNIGLKINVGRRVFDNPPLRKYS